MDRHVEAKRELIRNFRLKVDELQGLLQTYLSGERRIFGQGWSKTTEGDVAQLEGEVSALDKVIAHLERQTRDV